MRERCRAVLDGAWRWPNLISAVMCRSKCRSDSKAHTAPPVQLLRPLTQILFSRINRLMKVFIITSSSGCSVVLLCDPGSSQPLLLFSWIMKDTSRHPDCTDAVRPVCPSPRCCCCCQFTFVCQLTGTASVSVYVQPHAPTLNTGLPAELGK